MLMGDPRGYVTSGLTKSLGDEEFLLKEVVLPKVAMKRFGTPEEIANVVVFLLSDQSEYMTGSVSSPSPKTNIPASGG